MEFKNSTLSNQHLPSTSSHFSPLVKDLLKYSHYRTTASCIMNKALGMFQNQPSPSDSNNSASSTGLSRDDKHINIDTDSPLSKEHYILINNSAFYCSPIKLDLNFARMAMAEMVGTFILMFCVCGIVASTELVNGKVGLLEYAATAGLTVVVIIFSIGPISCAHVNPAATIAFATFGKFPWSKVPVYILAQIVGSVLATYIGSLVYGIQTNVMITRPTQGPVSAFWVELIATFIIMFLAAALTSQFQSVGHLCGFVYGIAIALAVLITGPVSGGSMNPARSLGPAIVSWKFKDIWIYITAPIAGGLAGVLLFRFLRLTHQSSNTSFSSPTTSQSRLEFWTHDFAATQNMELTLHDHNTHISISS